MSSLWSTQSHLTNIVTFLDARPPSHLVDAFAKAMLPIFPPRISLDGLGQLVSALLRFLLNRSLGEDLTKLFDMILLEYKKAFGVASMSMKKKVYNNFVQTYLEHWISAVSKQNVTTIKSSILSVGIETLLSVDVLRFTDCHLLSDSTSKQVHLLHRLQVLLTKPVLDFLPVFYASYVQSLYRYRSQLFTHGGKSSTRDGYKKTACAFFGSLFGLVDGVEPELDAWRTRLELLTVLCREVGGTSEASQQLLLSDIIRRAVDVLHQPSPSLKPLVAQSLSTIIQIDYDIMRPFVPQILESVLVLDGIQDAYIELLDLLLGCHVKTRTLDELVAVMINSVWAGRFSSREDERRGVVIQDDPFLDRLGKAIKSFGTVGQCVALVGCVIEFVEQGLSALERKTSQEEDMDGEKSLGLRLQIGSKVVCVVLAFLPVEMVFPSFEGEEKLEQLKNMRRELDRVVGGLVGYLGLRERIGELDLKLGLCALLRVKYVLDWHVFGVRGLGPSLGRDVEVLEGLVLLLERELEVGVEGLPSVLVFEIVRMVFLHLSTRQKQIATRRFKRKGREKKENEFPAYERFLDAVLAFVERYYPRTSTTSVSGWTGKDYDLTLRGKEGKTQCAIALVWMVVERWLSEVDSLATPRQIKMFMDAVLGAGAVGLAGMERGVVHPASILLNMLHSAWFWDFGRIRNELIELLKQRTSYISPHQIEGSWLRERVSIFRVLLYFPLEYFGFQVLSGFVGSAVEVDHALVRMCKRAEGDEREEVMRGLVVLRVFVRRVCVYIGGGGVLDFKGRSEAELLVGMLEEPILFDDDSDLKEGVEEDYLNASFDLAQVWFTKLLKASKKANEPVEFLRVLKLFSLDTICGHGRGHRRTLISKCFTHLVDVLDKEAGSSGVHERVRKALRVLRDELVKTLYVRIMKEVSKEALEDDWNVREYAGLVRVWGGLICLGRSLGLNGDETPSQYVGHKLVSVLVPHVRSRDVLDGGLEEFCIGVFSVVLEEAEYRNRDETVHNGGDEEGWRLKCLEVALAIYVSLGTKVAVSGLKMMDVRLGRTARRLSASDFEHVLSFITESLSDVWKACDARQLVHVGSLLVRDHPPHSLACVQKFMTRCLGLFNDNSVYVEGDPTLRLQVLEMLRQYCSDQQAALRAQDTSLIWLLISKLLAPAQTHDLDTQTDVFHKIVSILTCLVRLRRDLVTLGLPHLGLLLRRLVKALRGCRPNLGTKQLAIVMDTQPRWVSHARSLGGEEAKALSRLLESLNVKTTVRVFFGVEGSNNPPKAESLAKPFSKHAAYVLKAYVEAVNDPLCVMSLEVRKELKEGLFALCGMMGLHCRDALMVGLDAGGKAVLKAVWKEWEEVRYVGKG